MNELIKILQNHEDKYFYGEEKSLAPFVSGEFLEKFKETIFASDTHCKYNLNGKCYSEFTIKYYNSKNCIEFIDIEINKKGKEYDKVRFWFRHGQYLNVNDVKKIFIGHTESKIIKKEEFYNMIKQAEIELDDMVSENEEEDKETIKEFIDDYGSEIYDNYIVAVNKYNNDNKDIIYIEHKLGTETKFFFDLYGKIKHIYITEDSGYQVYMTINFKDTIKEEVVVEKQEEQENKLASEQALNELLNLYN